MSFVGESLAGKKWCPLWAKPSRQEVEPFADKSLAGKKWCPLRAKLSRQEVASFAGKNQPKKVESFAGKAQPAGSGVLCGQKLSRQEKCRLWQAADAEWDKDNITIEETRTLYRQHEYGRKRRKKCGF